MPSSPGRGQEEDGIRPGLHCDQSSGRVAGRCGEGSWPWTGAAGKVIARLKGPNGAFGDLVPEFVEWAPHGAQPKFYAN